MFGIKMQFAVIGFLLLVAVASAIQTYWKPRPSCNDSSAFLVRIPRLVTIDASVGLSYLPEKKSVTIAANAVNVDHAFVLANDLKGVFNVSLIVLHENAESSLDKEMELDVFVVHRYCGEPVVQQSVHTGVLIALMSNNMNCLDSAIASLDSDRIVLYDVDRSSVGTLCVAQSILWQRRDLIVSHNTLSSLRHHLRDCDITSVENKPHGLLHLQLEGDECGVTKQGSWQKVVYTANTLPPMSSITLQTKDIAHIQHDSFQIVHANVENIVTLDRVEYLQQYPNRIYAKTVYGWDVIKHGQMGVDWDPTFLMLVLPSSLRFFAICAMVGDTEDSKVPTVPYPSPSSSEGPSEDRMFRGPFGRIPNDLLEPYVSDDALVRLQVQGAWVGDDEDSVPSVVSSFLQGEAISLSPLVNHSKLLMSFKTSMMFVDCDSIVEVWNTSTTAGPRDPGTSAEVADTNIMEVLDAMKLYTDSTDVGYISVVFGRAITRNYWDEHSDSSKFVLSLDSNSALRLNLGPGMLVSSFSEDKFAYVHAVYSDLQSDVADYPKVFVSVSGTDDQRQNFQIGRDDLNVPLWFTLKVHDDPGQLVQRFGRMYGFDREGPVAHTVAYQIATHLLPPSFTGSPENVHARRRNSNYYNMELSRRFLSGEVKAHMNPSATPVICTASTVLSVLNGSRTRSTIAANRRSRKTDNSFFEKVTIGMTTCKRLETFTVTMEALELKTLDDFHRNHIAEIIVVDDASSTRDREYMLRTYPLVTFIFKSAAERGHGVSMNILMRHVTTRFFVYLEDDWKFLKNPVIPMGLQESLQNLQRVHINAAEDKEARPRGMGLMMEAAMSVIQRSIATKEPIAQVLFNEQAEMSCARGFVDPSHPRFNFDDPAAPPSYVDVGSLSGRPTDQHRVIDATCSMEVVGRGGWARTAVKPSIDEGEKDSNSTRTKVWPALGTSHFGDVGVQVPYGLHEFGLASMMEVYADRLQSRSVWPGFSFNPGLWDMTQISVAFDSCVFPRPSGDIVDCEACSNDASMSRDLFDEDSNAFEMKFSMLCHTIGLTTGFLPGVFFEHIGEEVSAYVLNGNPRVWDFPDENQWTRASF